MPRMIIVSPVPRTWMVLYLERGGSETPEGGTLTFCLVPEVTEHW